MSTPRTVKQQARALAAAKNISYTEALRRVLAQGPTANPPAAGHENVGAANLADLAGRATLEDLTKLGTVSALQASFLAAAVRAGKSIVISGAVGAGKTTLLRALCAQIPAGTTIGIFEETPELNLPERDPAALLRAIPATPDAAEPASDSRQTQAPTISDALYDAYRYNLSHHVVGEVRGREV